MNRLNKELIRTKEQAESENARIDSEYYRNIYRYCKTCIFFENGCTKKRIIRICRKKGLKNKE